jgi:hypothetical protein
MRERDMISKSFPSSSIRVLLYAAATLLIASTAQAGSVALRWTHPNPSGQGVVGFKLYQLTVTGSWDEVNDLAISGLIPVSGIYSYDVDVDETLSETFSVTAYSADEESIRSNLRIIDATIPTSAPPPGTALAQYSFDGSSSEIPGWLDTGAGNSLTESADAFRIAAIDGTDALMTDSSLTNIHSHILVAGSSRWANYEYSGRMRRSSGAGGLGVTAYSQFPQSDAYYRIRSQSIDEAFHLSPHPDGQYQMICKGPTSTGVVAAAGTWYRFKLRMETSTNSTRIRAKVWSETGEEPSGWQVDCRHLASNRLTFGTVGVWGMGSGARYWDDLEVRAVDPNPLLAPMILE